MIDALVKNDAAYFSGFFYAKSEDFQNNVNGVYFEYEEMRGNVYSISQIVQNLLSCDGRRAIRTKWSLPFAPNTWVMLDGERFVIENVETFRVDHTPQTNFLFQNPMTEYYLQLVKTDNPKGVRFQ